jgi:hypothetical protein
LIASVGSFTGNGKRCRTRNTDGYHVAATQIAVNDEIEEVPLSIRSLILID